MTGLVGAVRGAARDGLAGAALLLAHPAYRRTLLTYLLFSASVDAFKLLPVYVTALGGTEVAVGMFAALGGAASLVSRPLAGRWIDRAGRRPAMAWGARLMCLTAAATALTSRLPVLAVLRAAQGLGTSAFFVANLAQVTGVVRAEWRGRAVALAGVAALASTGLTPLVAELVVSRFGFATLFAGAAAVAALTSVMLGPRGETSGASAAAASPQTATASLPATAEGSQRPMSPEDERRALRRRVLALVLCFGIGSGTVITFVPTFVQHVTAGTLGPFFAAYGSAAVAVRLLGGPFIDTHRRVVVAPAMLAQAAGAALLSVLAWAGAPALATLPLLAAAGALTGVAQGFIYPSLAAIVLDEAPAHRAGSAVGVFSTAFRLGETVGPVVFGAIASTAGYGAGWTGLAVVLVGGALLGRRLAGPSPG